MIRYFISHTSVFIACEATPHTNVESTIDSLDNCDNSTRHKNYKSREKSMIVFHMNKSTTYAGSPSKLLSLALSWRGIFL